MSATTLPIPTDDGDLPGLLWLPENLEEPVPGLVVLQEIFGLSPYIRQRCADLAALGCAVLAPQLFARLDPPVAAVEDQEDVEAWLAEGMALTERLPWERAEADAIAALGALRAHGAVDSERVGLVGFCYGGGLAVAATASAAAEDRPPSVLVSYYGSALPTLLDRAAGIEVPSLHHFGTADSFIPEPMVEEIRRTVTAEGTREQVRFHLHEGAGHAFDNPHPALHHAAAAEAAWRQTVDVLAETLPLRR
ncbi:Dienelactone hydrolase family [Brachybacterium faecium]|uniref:Dienelactone hydrolase-like enzyme n=1 Tax=Brachybacterium faecium (strain ATCC 43885 / DSM 4810 / JCM 11609 / LMG 19847 / NBRC 14762 / NCIMB 9860 / 6-10) TaxID=446465 RepID=C7MFM7_BRAFD|nr:dienelactone hydrolase family protein [Brachybacterium faecium]ACU86244.1 dienelactone hydrolase-like enzyme [Brachybacterium faecium DSM 4810]SLN03986.1 Dienelactone hydrolase family [Brachybacterium faecium]HJG53157.1 dienelactone hydrolase family protein [Brachybacterium faecium]